jgi:two-component system, OmpR family, response regulator
MTADPHKRVLVVDDDQGVRGLLTSVLRSRGLSVDEAAGGRDALDLLATGRYAVILLDLILPDLDGFAVIEALRRSGEPQPIVLVVTGADRRAVERLDARLIHGIVRKPFEPEELADVVLACADIRGRNALGAMALAAMMAGPPLLALLHLPR